MVIAEEFMSLQRCKTTCEFLLDEQIISRVEIIIRTGPYPKEDSLLEEVRLIQEGKLVRSILLTRWAIEHLLFAKKQENRV